MSTPQGTFAWYELLTNDTAAAGAFYSNVVGWTTTEAPGMNYTIFNTKGVGVGGMMTIPEEAAAMGTGPCWTGYLVVDDVDAHTAKVVEAGGKVLKAPSDIPNMLRFSVVTDPQGAVFLLFTPNPAMPVGPPPPPPPHPNPAMPSPPNPPKPPEIGTIGWHELYTTDLDAAWEFYSTHFGWTKVTDMDMGAMGVYRIFSDGDATKTMGAGGMMTKPPNVPAPNWGFYVNVDAIGAAIERLTAGGGKVVNGPMPVPGGSTIVQAVDTQGTFFNLVSSNA
jgi:predicted enzyme related to lactoylglutathione lyase